MYVCIVNAETKTKILKMKTIKEQNRAEQFLNKKLFDGIESRELTEDIAVEVMEEYKNESTKQLVKVIEQLISEARLTNDYEYNTSLLEVIEKANAIIQK